MLSLAKLSSATAAKAYFDRDNYYADSAETPDERSAWFGRGASALGLSGSVEGGQFEAALEGSLPDGTILGRVVSGSMQRQPGWDLTFSAPKSVSILIETLDDDELRKAHVDAVEATLSRIEETLLETRIYNAATHQQEPVAGQGMLAALFHHDTSRALDPQTHTHTVLINAALGEDGKFRSVLSRAIYQHRQALGAWYRAELAENVRALGYELEFTHHMDGRFEIAGVPDALLKAFSTRANEIRTSMAERELTGPKRAAEAALKTRAAKQSLTGEALRSGWNERAKAQGVNLEALRDEIKRDAPDKLAISRPAAAERALSFAIEHLSEYEAAFRERDLMRFAYGAVAGSGARPADIDAQIQAAKTEGHLIEAKDGELKGYLTTPDAVKIERETVAEMRAGAAAVDPVMTRDALGNRLHNSILNDDQKAAVHGALTGVDRTIGLQGAAGVGKTTALRVLGEAVKGRGLTVVGLAPSSDAAHTLGKEAEIETMTAQRFLTQHGQGRPIPNLSKTVVIVDEASMLSTRQMRDLLRIANTGKAARILVVGDTKQLGAIAAGAPFAELQRAGMKTFKMEKILRQKSSDLREAVTNAMRGEIAAAFAKLDRVIIEANRSDLTVQAADRWLKLEAKARAATEIVAPTNKLKDAVSARIREALRHEGQLGTSAPLNTVRRIALSKAERTRVSSYRIGQTLVFARPYKRLGIARGDRAKVARIDEANGTVTLYKGGQLFDWTPAQIAGRTDGAFEVFEDRKLDIAEGDRVRFTRNDRAVGIVNGARAVVEKVRARGVVFRLDSGRRLALPKSASALSHLDHDYANTVHAFQGRTVDRIIAVMDSRKSLLTDQKSFYVAISRARHAAEIITDDKADLQATLEANSGEKTTAKSVAERPSDEATKRDGMDAGIPSELAAETTRKDAENSQDKSRALAPRDEIKSDADRTRKSEKQSTRERLFGGKKMREQIREMEKIMERSQDLDLSR